MAKNTKLYVSFDRRSGHYSFTATATGTGESLENHSGISYNDLRKHLRQYSRNTAILDLGGVPHGMHGKVFDLIRR